MLHYTSFAFGTAAVHAGLRGASWDQAALTALMGLSILNHAKKDAPYAGKRAVMWSDRILAHVVPLSMAWRLRHRRQTSPGFWASFAYVVGIFYAKISRTKDVRRATPWHASMHLVGAIGAHCFLASRRDRLRP